MQAQEPEEEVSPSAYMVKGLRYLIARYDRLSASDSSSFDLHKLFKWTIFKL